VGGVTVDGRVGRGGYSSNKGSVYNGSDEGIVEVGTFTRGKWMGECFFVGYLDGSYTYLLLAFRP
jgi:hypothetical protein